MNTDWKKELKKKAIGYILKDDGKPTILRIEEVIPFIESLLKEQREDCAEEYLSQFLSGAEENNNYIMNIKNKILNAPEPSGVKK